LPSFRVLMTSRTSIIPGLVVDIILKKDQASGLKTRGVVKEILTNSQNHHRGIKVKLQNGQVGRVAGIISTVTPAVSAALTAGVTSGPAANSKPNSILLSDFIQQKLDLKAKDWNCTKCTFLNSHFLDSCEICNFSK
jgi:uncharacterized repeat protein (TIGR03833 family)